MDERETLEKFILNNKELEKIENLIVQFNSFETLNIVNAEIRHSYVLSWLFNPKANHGFGEYFVKLFLKYILNFNKSDIKSKLTIFDLEKFNYNDLEIRREWLNIDILLISEKNNFVIVIENKITSSEHDNQLARYFNTINREFPKFEKIFIYLAPEANEDIDENWIFSDYNLILKILDDLIEQKGKSLDRDVVRFVEQYATIIRRYVVSNSEIELICRDIYKKHQAALDLIFQYKPDIDYEVSEIVQELIKSTPELILDTAGKTVIRFTSKQLDELVPKNSSGWTNSKRIFLFEFTNYNRKLILRLIIGPGDEELRNKLQRLANKNITLFNKSRRQIGKKWFTVYQNEFLKEGDYEEDREGLRIKVDKKFKSFINDDLNKIVSHYADNWKV